MRVDFIFSLWNWMFDPAIHTTDQMGLKPEAGAMKGFQTRLTNASHQARQFGRDRLKDTNILEPVILTSLCPTK
ncbi:hypothetical protein EJB05_33504 [Eragrostis curvula]|uniref:Uncharacterized protein n=1 Tax=Eragrostis curvula TaxID=38414 RepID=A0A5J9U1F4_9POAL|nr:hypothetical protein EJB05_33504 [Eragrostis curvula]